MASGRQKRSLLHVPGGTFLKHLLLFEFLTFTFKPRHAMKLEEKSSREMCFYQRSLKAQNRSTLRTSVRRHVRDGLHHRLEDPFKGNIPWLTGFTVCGQLEGETVFWEWARQASAQAGEEWMGRGDWFRGGSRASWFRVRPRLTSVERKAILSSIF